MERHALLGLLALLALAAPSRAPASDPAEAGRLGIAIEREVAQGFTGTLLVARGNRIILHRAYGTVRRVPMRLDSRYWISSMGKQFVSAAILRLRDEGRLSLDEPIARWFPNAPADKAAITIRQLLAHLSGLPQGYLGEQASSNEEAARAILAVPLRQAPGQAFLYSNDNYQLAAAIVERASGLSYRDFVQQRFFGPLRMRDTGVADGPADVAPTPAPTPERLSRPQWGIGGHYASGPDLLTWYRALRNGRILRPISLRELWEPAARTGEGRAALGWFLSPSARNAERIWTRGNDDFGPNSLIYTYPGRNVAIIILSHAGQKTEDLSYSRAMLAALEGALRL